jgi:HSP20 family protein
MTYYISPYRRLSTLRQTMDRLLEESLADNSSTEREMVLAVDIKAEEDGYTIRSFVPGLESDDLEIEIINNTVTIRGQYKPVEEDGKYLASELPVGTFSRVMALPTPLDPTKAEANLKNGVLTLRVPKAEAHRPKTIKVSRN